MRAIRHYSIPLLLLSLTTLSGVLAASDVRAASVYTDPATGISFRLPDGYRICRECPTTEFRGPRSHTNIGLVALIPTDQLGDQSIQQFAIASFGDELTADGVQPVILGGLPAVQFDVLEVRAGVRVRDRSYLFITTDTLYGLIFSAPDTDFDVFFNEAKSILDTIMIPNAMTA